MPDQRVRTCRDDPLFVLDLDRGGGECIFAEDEEDDVSGIIDPGIAKDEA